MSKILKHAQDWWNKTPQETGIVPVLLDEVEPAPAPMATEAKVVQHGFIQAMLSMERQHASALRELSQATLRL